MQRPSPKPKGIVGYKPASKAERLARTMKKLRQRAEAKERAANST